MALTLSTTINSDLAGFLESSIVTAATSAFAANPVAARTLLTNALIALFSPELAGVVAVACAAAAAAYLLSRFGNDNRQPLATTYSSTLGYSAVTFQYIQVTGATVTSPLTWTCSNTARFASFTDFYKTGQQQTFSGVVHDFWKYNWTAISGSSGSGGGTEGYQVPVGNNISWIVKTACPGSTVTSVGGSYPTLSADAEKSVKALVIPRLVPATEPDLTPLLEGQAETNQKVDDCCETTQTNLGDVQNTLNTSVSNNSSSYSDLLARIKKISRNIGLPDIDGSNTGYIFGPYGSGTTTIGAAIDALWKSLGAFDENNSVTLAGTASVAASLLSYTKILDQRIGYFAEVDINVGPQLNLTITNVQTHLQQLDVGLPEPSYSIGYQGSEEPTSMLKIGYTDRTAYTYRLQAQLTIRNPKPDLTDEDIQAVVNTRTLGAYWCSIVCADETKISAWAVSASAGQTFLTNACALQDSGFKVPLEFNATLKTRGVPIISNILLTATSLVHTTLNSTGQYVTTRKRINVT